MTPSDQTELRQKLQLLKGSNGEYVLSTITDLYALVDFIAEAEQRAVKTKLEKLYNHRVILTEESAVNDLIPIVFASDIEHELAELEQSLRKEQE